MRRQRRGRRLRVDHGSSLQRGGLPTIRQEGIARETGKEEPMSGRIVVGVDGSEEARLATHWAAREARLRGAKLELLSAWEVPSFAYGYASEFVATAGDLAKDLEKVTEDQLEVALEDVRTEEADADVEARA